MFTAHLQYADGRSQKVRSFGDFRVAYDRQPDRFWIDLESPDHEEVVRVGELLHLDDEAIEDCIHGEQRPRIDDYETYFLLVMYGVLPPEGLPPEGLGIDQLTTDEARKLVVVCGPHFVVTAHAEPLRTTTLLRDHCGKHGEACLGRGVDRLIFRLVDQVADNYLLLIDEFDDGVENLEERSFELCDEDNLLQDVAALRRRLLEVHRLAKAQRVSIEPITRGDFEIISDEMTIQFVHVKDHLIHVMDRCDAMRDRLTGALHNYHSTLAKRTNDIMRVLTVFAAVVLPLSLVAGVYGMNVPTWPSGDSRSSFWGILILMAGVAGALLLYFRRKNWL